MGRKKGALGKATLIKYLEAHKNGEKVPRKIMKQIKERGIDKDETAVPAKKKKKVRKTASPSEIRARAKIKKKVPTKKKKEKKVPIVGGPERVIWKEHGKTYRFQIDNCTKTEAAKLVKAYGARIAATAYMGKSPRKTFVFRREFADMADAKRWAKKNKFKMIKP